MLADLARLGIPPRTDYARALATYLACQPLPDHASRLRRARAAFRVGDYGPAMEDAKWCLLHRPASVAANKVYGLAALGAAADRLLGLPMLGAGGKNAPSDPHLLLRRAGQAFMRLRQARPDDVGAEGLRLVERLGRHCEAMVLGSETA